MTVLQHPWDAYARLQDELLNRASADDGSWGLEEGLNRFLTAATAEELEPDSIRRTVSSAARRSRYARQLRSKSSSAGAVVGNTVDQLEARSALHLMERGLDQPTRDLLISVAIGHDYAVLAARQFCSVPALRTRVSRARSMASLRLAA